MKCFIPVKHQFANTQNIFDLYRTPCNNFIPFIVMFEFVECPQNKLTPVIAWIMKLSNQQDNFFFFFKIVNY